MKKIAVLTALAIALPFAGASAQELPGWPTNAACSQGDDWCPRYEQRTRVEVAGIWQTLPPEIRSQCVSETETIEKSYRLLYDCLANRMQEHITGQARQR